MAWPKNEKAEEMYELYKAGASLAGVAKVYGKTRQSVSATVMPKSLIVM
jgi:hypothetical protein